MYQKSEKGHFEDLLEQEKADAQKREVIAFAAAADRERQLAGFLGAIGLFATLGIAFFARMRRKNERLKTEKERAEQAARAVIADQKLKEAETEMAHQREQLENFTRFIVEKNQQIEALSKPADHQHDDATNENIEALYGQSILTENDWERFKTYFERVHPGFLARLRHQFSDLSHAETRLFLLLKMGMSARDMAAMLGVSSETIKKTRYRIRKKLNLEDERLEGLVAGI